MVRKEKNALNSEKFTKQDIYAIQGEVAWIFCLILIHSGIDL